MTVRKGPAESLWLAMRPWQWVKNLFVLAPLLFSQNLVVPPAVGRAVGAFLLFCLVSSSVYLLNDISKAAATLVAAGLVLFASKIAGCMTEARVSW